MTPNPHAALTEDALRTATPVARIGRRIVCLDETGSTNDDAFALACGAGPSADGTAIFAERQTAGRGRLGRQWLSPRGASIHCSALLFEPTGDASPGHVALAGGLAACRAIEHATHLKPNVRWPNDVFLSGRKVGGVLVERRETAPGVTAMVIGIGINCLQHQVHFPPELRGRATSLEIESAGAIDRLAVARELLGALNEWFAAPGKLDAARLIREWRARSDDIGTRVTVAANGRTYRGRILDVEPDAGLLFQSDDGVRLGFDAAVASILERHP